LIGFLINGLAGKKIGNRLVGVIASSVIGIAFLLSLSALFELLALPPSSRQIEVNFYTWLTAGDLSIPLGMLLDPLSAVMILVVTGVSFLIHIYSIGYMKTDPSYSRYFSYLNLFVFFMLLLVLGNSYPIMFIGWEGVGLCSYLLIGFWFTDKAKASAGKKAFIVNRIGDFGFLIGIFLIYTTFGTLSFSGVAEQVSVWSGSASVMFWMTLALFVGATGKSAQIPLYVWLPDAMAGPTPVSALIHAATMVTAGVYMVARNSFLFVHAPLTLEIVAWVGVLTALFAASIALVQNDIKKVLAYSTVSQLGYMFVGCGVGAYAAGVSHLVTHAFFKALLFLGAGSVIHAVEHSLHKANVHADPQDIRLMGGLKNKMPRTYLTFFIACLAIAGVPGLSGFFSKDEIIWMSFASGHTAIGIIALIAAGMTAFYMFRLLFLTFFGSWRGKKSAEDGVHESPSVMTIPLTVLAVLAVIGGWIMIPPALFGGAQFEHFLQPVFRIAEESSFVALSHSHAFEYSIMLISVAVAAFGIWRAYRWYIVSPELPAQFAAKMKGWHKLLLNKYYVDEIYEKSVINPTGSLGNGLWKYFDIPVIDGVVNGVAKLIGQLAEGLRHIQTGLIANYALAIAAGVVVVVGYMVWF